MKLSYVTLFTLSLLIMSVGVYAYADTTVFVQEGANDPACADTDSCISPSSVTITPGETVTWIVPQITPPIQFLGGTPQTGWAGDGFLDTRSIVFGEPQEWTYDDLGTFPYFEPNYPWMTGIVTVADPVSSDMFTITNLLVLGDAGEVTDTVPTNEIFVITFDVNSFVEVRQDFWTEIIIQGPSGEIEAFHSNVSPGGIRSIDHTAIPLKPGPHAVIVTIYDNMIDLNPIAPVSTIFFDIDGPEFFSNSELAFIVRDLQEQIDALAAQINVLESIHEGTFSFSQRAEIITSDNTQ